MSKRVYIARTNKSDNRDFNKVRSLLEAMLGREHVSYYDSGTSFMIGDADLLIVIPTSAEYECFEGYIGKGVEKQVDQAEDKNIPIYLYDKENDLFYNMDDGEFIYDEIVSPKDWNSTVYLEWYYAASYSINEVLKEIEMKEKGKMSWSSVTGTGARKAYEHTGKNEIIQESIRFTDDTKRLILMLG